MNKWINKVVVIIDGSTGAGLATAHRFIEDGAQVVIAGCNQGALDTAVAEFGIRAICIRDDVMNFDHLNRLFVQVQEQFGPVDVFFANAGSIPFVPFEVRSATHE